VKEEVQCGTVLLVRGTATDPSVMNLGPGMPSFAGFFCANSREALLTVIKQNADIFKVLNLIYMLLVAPKAKLEAYSTR
jgi:hypothetical protein